MDGRRQRLLAELQALPGTLEVHYGAGELIFQEGAFAAGVYVVAEGLVIRGGYVLGTSQPVAVAGPGDLLGVETWRLDIPPRYWGFARALTAAILRFAPAGVWKEALEQERFRDLVLSILAESVLDWHTLALYREHAERVLAWFLLRWGQDDGDQVRLPVSTTLLASLLGLSRHTVRQALTQLAGMGAVGQADGEIVGNRDRLRAVLGEAALIGSPR
ncbi:Crp/Fnr family transcriptional regulator [Candidatus Bipolaricaulota bacterium]|nr:Crp/Fnr family transcriptional regulator [Candidatus Bipolaricaulota bacterium]